MPFGELKEDVRDEVVSLLRDLIRIDTTNPPGNEVQAAEYVAKTLEKEGFDCELYESKPTRGSVTVSLDGTGERPRLALLSHLDVVAADPKEWSVDPFSGVVKDGFVWGRGALDMKSLTAVEIMVLKLLKRNRVKLNGGIVLVATADEEKGGEDGAGWLTRNYPEKVRADYVLNEGGGLSLPLNGRDVFTIQTAEKGMLWFRVRAKGTPGHGSIPGASDNAIVRMNRVVGKLAGYRASIVLTPTVKEYLHQISDVENGDWQELRTIVDNPNVADGILDKLGGKDKFFAEELRAKLRMTVTPTMINGGVKENIIPSRCEAVFDCRVLPGQTTGEALATVKNLLGDVDLEKLEFEVIEASEPSESALHTPLYELIIDVLNKFDSRFIVAPDMLTGGTDSRFFRELGAVCYGFHPMRLDMPYGDLMKGIHGVDERISIDNLVFGTQVLYDVVERFVTQVNL